MTAVLDMEAPDILMKPEKMMVTKGSITSMTRMMTTEAGRSIL